MLQWLSAWGRGEMADAQVLGTCGAIREGSTPSVPTNRNRMQRNAPTSTLLVGAFFVSIQPFVQPLAAQ